MDIFKLISKSERPKTDYGYLILNTELIDLNNRIAGMHNYVGLHYKVLRELFINRRNEVENCLIILNKEKKENE